MQIIHSLDDIQPGEPSVVTVGVFDGVHLGHQAIMQIVKTAADSVGARSVAVTFSGNPEEYVHPDITVPYITTLRQKLRLIERQRMDMTVVLPLEPAIMEMSAEEFVTDVLSRRLRATQVIVGSNFAFGKGRAGDVKLLRRMGKTLGFDVLAVSPIRIEHTIVSSTAIRGLLLDGRVEFAADLLGRPFALEGEVVRGDGIGRSLGYPTANIQPAPRQVVPRTGVYAVRVKLGSTTTMTGVLNIGTRPTVSGRSVRVEVHILNFNADLYGRRLEVCFLRRLRDETRFADTESLKAQIAADIEQAVRLVG